jgi:predicted glycosyltransferase
MKYLIDIYHIPQYNFFKNTIDILGPEKVDLCCVDRGKLVEIITKESPKFKLYVLGDYKKNKGRWSLATRIVLPRLLGLYRLLKVNQYNVVGSASYQVNFVSKLLKIPNFSIMDDPRNFIVRILSFSTNNFYLPLFNRKYGNAKSFNALKEWAYLSPKYFSSNKEILDEYGLKEKRYYFMREVSTDTSNYLGQAKNLILELSKKIDNNIPVVLSLENKQLKELYPKNWIILEEPVSDIHSLMYYSSVIISSGDSMAREGAMLGVPSVYLGYRDMPANQILIDKGILFKLNLKETIVFLKNQKVFDQKKIREQLFNEWDDVTELIINLFYKLSKS